MADSCYGPEWPDEGRLAAGRRVDPGKPAREVWPHSAEADAGWSLVEVLVSVAIVLVLSATVGVVSSRYLGQARIAAVRSQFAVYSLALESYYVDCGCYPSEAQGLSALWKRPVLEPQPDGWAGPYLNRPVSSNPWGREYEYRTPGSNGLPYLIITETPHGTLSSID